MAPDRELAEIARYFFGSCESFAKYVSEASDGKFQIQTFAAGEIVPGLQTLDAVQNGTVEMGHTAYYYYIGKDPTWALFCAVPFGLNARQQNAWFYEGEGQKLMDEFGKKFNTYNLLMGNTGCQMAAGSTKRSRKRTTSTVSRCASAVGRQNVQKLGLIPQQLAAGDIYPALEKGTIDAAEWVGPYDDEKLGFYKWQSTTITLAGGKAARPTTCRSISKVECLAEGVSVYRRAAAGTVNARAGALRFAQPRR